MISLDEYDDSSTSEDEGEEKKVMSLRKAAVRLQRSFRRRKFVTVVEKSLMLSKKRKHALNEIISSEKVMRIKREMFGCSFY